MRIGESMSVYPECFGNVGSTKNNEQTRKMERKMERTKERGNQMNNNNQAIQGGSSNKQL